MKMKAMPRARAYAVPDEANLDKFARLLARAAGTEGLTINAEDGAWVLKQGARRLSAAYTKGEIVACVSGYIAGLRAANQG